MIGCWLFPSMSGLWYHVVGCILVNGFAFYFHNAMNDMPCRMLEAPVTAVCKC